MTIPDTKEDLVARQLRARADTLNGVRPHGINLADDGSLGYYSVHDQIMDREVANLIDTLTAEIERKTEVCRIDRAHAEHNLARALTAESERSTLQGEVERLRGQAWREVDSVPRDGTRCDLLLSSGREVTCAYWGETLGGGEEGWFVNDTWARGEDEEVIRWRPYRSPLSALKPTPP